MKKSFIALAALSAFAGAAYAQSSVTLYGLIDEGFNFTNNVRGDRDWRTQSGTLQGSRWGLKGAEDLGGGLKAIFNLESGFDLSNGVAGQNGGLFGRQAYVGLAGEQWGSVTIGRQFDSMNDFVGPLTGGTAFGLLFAHPYDSDNLNGSFRTNNSVKYTSASYNGLQFGTEYGFSNTVGQFSSNRSKSVGVGYNNGPLALGAGFLQVDNPGGNATGAVAGDQSWTTGPNGFQRTYGAGINYTVASATFGFVYSHADLRDPTTTSFGSGIAFPGQGSSIRFDNFEVNAKFALTPAFNLGGMYTYTYGKFNPVGGNTSRPRWHTVGLSGDYNLSKRTDIYVQGVYQQVTNANTGTALDNAYIVGAADSSSNNRQFIGRVGLRHKF